MFKKTIERFMPDHEKIKRQKVLKIFGKRLYNQNLWRLNRRSAAGAFAVGLFVAFIPLPSQMLIAASFALLFSVNLPLSVALVWISNPFTIPPLFYFAYQVGRLVLRMPEQSINFELSWMVLHEQINTIGPPLLLGCFICGSVVSFTSYFLIHYLWRRSVAQSWKRRHQQRKDLMLGKIVKRTRKQVKKDKSKVCGSLSSEAPDDKPDSLS